MDQLIKTQDEGDGVVVQSVKVYKSHLFVMYEARLFVNGKCVLFLHTNDSGEAEKNFLTLTDNVVFPQHRDSIKMLEDD